MFFYIKISLSKARTTQQTQTHKNKPTNPQLPPLAHTASSTATHNPHKSKLLAKTKSQTRQRTATTKTSPQLSLKQIIKENPP